MNWWQPEQFAMKRKNLETRAQVIKAVRAWFDSQNFIETQTPALQVMGAPDTHIKPFQADDFELHTSPEIAMKKLLVAGMERIYQICPVFRKEIEGRLHAQEFTMLEWYRAGTDYTAMMDDCESLLKSLGFEIFNGEWERLSVVEAFDKYAGITLPIMSSFGSTKGSRDKQPDPAIQSQDDALREFKSQAQFIGVRSPETDTWEDIFHAIMAEKIEPNLGQVGVGGAPTILYDYPVCMASLARKAKDDRFAERFELYINGIELANAFSELTGAKEQRTRLEVELKAKKDMYGIETPLDEDFIEALELGMPESSGCALGLDRLVMLACGVDNIDDVLWTTKP